MGNFLKKKSILALLHSYAPMPEEERHKIKIIDFIQQYENCFERTLEIGHVTASAWLLNKDCSKVLLMHHRKLDMWVQPGGHCDGDSDVLGVALKEAQEESGLQKIEPIMTDIFDIDIHLIPETKKEKAHYHYDIRFLVQAIGNDTLVQNNESNALRWFGKNDPLPTKERSVIRMYEKWRSSENFVESIF